MPAAYPSSLPLPILGHTREQPAAFQVAQPRRGWGYVEPTGTDTPVFWPVSWKFTKAQAQTFRRWFVYTIERGTLPFTTQIKTEFGLIEHEMTFLPDSLLPARHLGGDVWEYSATVMARSLVDECVTLYERFASGLTPYTVLRGNGGLFTVSGDVLTVASQTSVNAATIQRALQDDIVLPIRRFGCEFRCTSLGTDDSAAMFVMNGGDTVNVLALTPIRDAAADPSRRPRIDWAGTAGGLLGATQVALSTWYRFSASLTPGVGVAWSIYDMDGLSSWGSGTLALPTAAAFEADGIGWNADSPNTTGAVQFRNAWISDCET